MNAAAAYLLLRNIGKGFDDVDLSWKLPRRTWSNLARVAAVLAAYGAQAAGLAFWMRGRFSPAGVIYFSLTTAVFSSLALTMLAGLCWAAVSTFRRR